MFEQIMDGVRRASESSLQMQQEMLRIQGELETTLVDGSAGGGVVSATVTGKQELVSVTIDSAHRRGVSRRFSSSRSTCRTRSASRK